MRRLLAKSLIVLALVIGTMHTQVSAKESIKVIIDQEPLTLKQSPLLEGENIFLPLREIFDGLGVRVEWEPSTQSIVGIKDDTIIQLEIKKGQAFVNNKKILMDIECKIIDGNVMIPVRFVKEGFDLDIDWNNDNQTLIIKNGSSSYKSSNFRDDYIEITDNKEGSIKIEGKTLSGNRYILLELLDLGGEEIFNGQSQIGEDGKFEQVYPIDINNGQYIINIFMNDNEYGIYTGIDTGIMITKTNGNLVFNKSPVYRNNMEHLIKNNKVSVSDLNMELLPEEGNKILYNLAKDITNGEGREYDKVLAIANWVSSNIYYDIDAAETGQLGKTDAIGTLNEKRSVCQGYASLTTGLLRSIGIPTKLVFGYALGIDTDISNWNQVGEVGPNHVWNEVFVDNRWIIVDTTWNSQNRYEKGEYIEGANIYSYFDPTIEAFSNTHKITNR